MPLLRSADEPPWHPALLDDALEVLRDLQSAYDGGAAAKVFLAGFSGSTTLLSLLLAHVSERRPELLLRRDAGVQIVGALCCCFCCDYARAKQLLETSVLGRLYSWLLAGAYQATLCANASTAAQSSSDAWEAARRARFLSDYDRAVYRLCGFASVEAMHAAFAITDSVLARIRVPTLFLQPADDPLHLLSFGSVRAGVPVERLVANPRLLYVEPSHGAHFGFVGSGGVGGDDSYTHAPKVAMVFFETVLADARC